MNQTCPEGAPFVNPMSMALKSVTKRHSVSIVGWIIIRRTSVLGWGTTRCGVQGHASKLHLATDLKFRLAIMNTHGPESFSHFWADEERKEDDLAPQVIQPVQQAAPAKPIERSRGGSGTGGNWSNQAGCWGRGAYAGKGGRHQESKPYYRQQIDPWTVPGNSQGSKKPKR